MTALWWAVIVSGIYHGLNPGMGWPLAVSAALMEGRLAALPRALLMLALGHFVAMVVILLPFSMMLWLVENEARIRIGAGVIVIATGVYLLINTRHPRFLARIHPSKLALWSFLAALVHGAALMLVPIYLGLCKVGGQSAMDRGHSAAQSLMSNDVMTALFVALIHTGAMVLSGAVLAVFVYWWLGLKFISQSWFNLDRVWALSLIFVGAFGLFSAL